MKRYLKFFQTLLRFSAGINRLSFTVFMQSVHRASRPHGLFYHSAHLAGIWSKKFASFDTVCFGHRLRRNFRLSLYRANREISKVCLQIIFVPIEIGQFRTSIHGNCFGHGNKNIYTWCADTFSNDVIMSWKISKSITRRNYRSNKAHYLQLPTCLPKLFVVLTQNVLR